MSLFSSVINIPQDYLTIQEGINVSVNADTVLVQPGTYTENINYNGKNITIASLYITTQDTSYISQTIIDGNQNGSVVTFESGENYTTVLIGFSLTGGSGKHFIIEEEPYIYYNHYRGGAIYCENSNPEIAYIKIYNNEANEGGGIYCLNSNSNINNIKILNNLAYWGEYFLCDGGGFYCNSSNLLIENIELLNNSADGSGGGLYTRNTSNLSIENLSSHNNIAGSGGGLFFHGSNSEITNAQIFNNSTSNRGGGITCRNSCNITLTNVSISDNNSEQKGGGVFCAYGSNLNLINSSILNNVSQQEGGGISCVNSNITFDSINRNSLYSNSAIFGNDIFSDTYMNVIVDTFTVLEPTDYFASPIDNFSFDINNAVYTLINSDVYVSPNGDNSNAGTSWGEALKTIHCALSRIQTNNNYPKTIFLDSGTFSSETNGEIFPIYPISYVTIQGVSEEATIICGDNQNYGMHFNQVNDVIIEELKITNGNPGVHIYSASPQLNNITISNNSRGIYCNDATLLCDSITVSENVADDGAGMWLVYSDLTMNNSIIEGNQAIDNDGGGIFFIESEFVINNCKITNNYSYSRGGGLFIMETSGDVINSQIISNRASTGGGFYNCNNSEIYLENVDIVYNKAHQGGGFNHAGGPNTYTTNILFDPIDRCSIYFNQAARANDFYINSYNQIEVLVDTFTVLNPTKFHFGDNSDFSIDIWHGKVDQIASDLYVSPEGDDQNIGNNSDNPLKTIYMASTKIIADESNNRIINLLPGIYSSATNNENFPISCADFVTYKGQSTTETILDANYICSVISLNYCEQSTFENLKIKHGSNSGLHIYQSNAVLNKIEISDNTHSTTGAGGILAYYSNVKLFNTNIINNQSGNGVGAIKCHGSEMYLVNTLLWDNSEEQIQISGGDGSMLVAYSDIQWGENSINIFEGCELYFEESNINEDPLFNWNYYLPENSPCVDAGINYFEWNSEILLNLQPDEYYGPAPDIGAYEYGFVEADELNVISLNQFNISQNYPNPFNPETLIKFSIPEDSKVDITVYNVKGQKVKNLVKNDLEKGIHEIIWNSKDDNNRSVASGVYFYQFIVNGKTKKVKKCLLLK